MQAGPATKIPGTRSSRREFIKAGALALAGTLLSGADRATAAARSRPNVLILFTDDQNPACVGYANPRIATPNLDRMARAGTVFEAAYAGAVPCTPSRGCLMTGLNGHRWKANLHRLVPGEWTWAHALRRAGYHTALIGKMHFQPMRADHGFEHAEYCEHRYSRMPRNAEDDFERWLREKGVEPLRTTKRLWLWPRDPELHPISWLRDRAIAYLEARKKDGAPFCLLASFQHPHEPCDPTREFAARYDPASLEVPRETLPQAGELPPRLMRSFASAPHVAAGERGAEYLRRYYHLYYALVSQIDAAAGAIVAHADLENTLVLFTSDHGHYLGWRSLMAKEPYVGFEPVGRVPFFACGAGVPRGRTIPHPVSLLDVAPTLLRAAGAEVPPDLDGSALQDYFTKPDFGAERAVFCRGLPGHAGGFDMLRRARHKYFRSQEGGDELVFDLSSDPGERHNLAADPELEEIRKELSAEMDAVWARREHGLPRVEETARSG